MSAHEDFVRALRSAGAEVARRHGRVLKDITINEVSSVDRGAGRGVKVMMMKRLDGDDPMDADFKELMVKVDKTDAVERLFADVIDPTIEAGKFSNAAATAYLDLRVTHLQKADETKEAAFVRVAVGADGRGGSDAFATGLFKRSRNMTMTAFANGAPSAGFEIQNKLAFDKFYPVRKEGASQAQGAATTAQRVAYDPQFPNATIAPADQSETPLGTLELWAAAIRRDDPSLTPEQAFAQAAATPAGVALMRADKRIRLGSGF